MNLFNTPKATAPQIDATAWLRELLSVGPKDSAAAKALAVAAGIGPKALRNARERLQVCTVRSGNRGSMRSTWELPRSAVPYRNAPERAPATYSEPRGADSEGRDSGAIRAPDEGNQLSSSVKVFDFLPRDLEYVEKSQGQRETEGIDSSAPARERRGVRGPNLTATLGKNSAAPRLDSLSTAARRRIDARIELFIQRGLSLQEASQIAVALAERDLGSSQALGSCVECGNLLTGDCPVVPQPPSQIHQCWS